MRSVPSGKTWRVFQVCGLKHAPSMGSLLSATGLPFTYVGMTDGSESNLSFDLQRVISCQRDDLEIKLKKILKYGFFKVILNLNIIMKCSIDLLQTTTLISVLLIWRDPLKGHKVIN